MKNNQELINELMNIGLNQNESKVYLTLIKRNDFSVSEIANESGVPRVKVYGVLKILMNKGFCISTPGKIIRYIAEAPKFILSNNIDELNKKVEEAKNTSKKLESILQPIFDNGVKEDSPLNYINIVKENKQIANIFISLENTKKEILLFVKSPFVINDLKKGLVNLKKVKAVCEKQELKNKNVVSFLNKILSEKGKVKIIDKLPIKMAIFDKKISMVNIKDYSHDEILTTTVVEHPDYANLLIESFTSIWVRATNYTKIKEIE
jgi:sugar-specific transcriptional regulator TrmB